jgi:UDP-2,3-diacylglucosamine hydrolase
MIDLNDGAIFIADAHYQVGIREEFYDFLVSVENGTIKTKELIFMGDMFDLLVGSIEFTIDKNQKVIDLINSLSKTIKIIYLEGNHDFDLQRIFSNVKVVTLQRQPLVLMYHNQKIALVHGDNFGGFWYGVYTNFIRNSLVLKILNIIDRSNDNFISKKILKEQETKQICKKTKEFNEIAKQKLKFYDIATNRFDLICEGHYHMDREYEDNKVRHRFFPSYACGMNYLKISFAEKVVFNQLKG